MVERRGQHTQSVGQGLALENAHPASLLLWFSVTGTDVPDW